MHLWLALLALLIASTATAAVPPSIEHPAIQPEKAKEAVPGKRRCGEPKTIVMLGRTAKGDTVVIGVIRVWEPCK